MYEVGRKYYVFTFAILLILAVSVNSQLYVESVFGFDNFPQRWGRNFDGQVWVWDIPWDASLVRPADAASISLVGGDNTTEIILICDSGSWALRWLRCEQRGDRKRLRHMGFYRSNIQQPVSIAVASIDTVYNPDLDHFFVADRLNRRIAKFNFNFDFSNPRNDEIILEDSLLIDSLFSPVDLQYIDFETGDRFDNRLLALDDNGHRLFLFTDDGSLMRQIDMNEYDDSLSSLYAAFTHRVVDSNTVAVYLADRNSASIRLFNLSANGDLGQVCHLNIGNRLNIQINDVIYDDRLGLWAIDSNEPCFYKIANDLSRIIACIQIQDFDLFSLNYPFNISLMADRIVVLENAGENTGMISFAFNQPRAKETSQEDEEPLPFQYALNQNYPNPFNPYTTIKYEIPFDGHVNIEVFNILGQKVRTLVDESKRAGRYSVLWNGLNKSGRSVASGVYFYKLKSGEYTNIKKMTVLK